MISTLAIGRFHQIWPAAHQLAVAGTTHLKRERSRSTSDSLLAFSRILVDRLPWHDFQRHVEFTLNGRRALDQTQLLSFGIGSGYLEYTRCGLRLVGEHGAVRGLTSPSGTSPEPSLS